MTNPKTASENENADIVATTEALDEQISTLTSQMTELSACMGDVADGFAEFDESREDLTQAKQRITATTPGQPTAGD
jgi:peptidoglycan hydrolase CwlO-like protein